MRIRRLVSIALVVLGIAPRGIAPATPTPGSALTSLLVSVTEVAPDRATVWFRTERSRRVVLRYAPVEGDALPRAMTLETDRHRDHTGRVVLTGLAPGTRYAYEIDAADERVDGTFTTAPAASDGAPVRILWSADLGGGGHCRDVEDGYPIFHAMRRRHASLFLFLGDTIYADHLCGSRLGARHPEFVATSLDGFYAKHRDNREDHAVQAFLRQTPVYATWDDHEVTNNFAGRDEPLMPVGRRAFQDYWAVEGPPEEPGRLYRRVRWGRHVEIFILDTRQYRTANQTLDGPGKTMLGTAQRKWLLDGLAESDATWKLIVTTVPLGMFTGGAVSDSWSNANIVGFPRPGTGFVHERDFILRSIRALGMERVVFLSGDVHHAQLLRHEPVPGFVVHELVAGPLSARQGFPRFLDRSLRSRSLASLGWAHNFGEIDVDSAQLTVRVLDTAGAVRASVKIPAVAEPVIAVKHRAERRTR